ncbi:Fic/DOC family protein [Pedococcus dokdonensis]|uniref:Fic/DOC family protein n=1 Tax=Pedococcus dokdonensis TaxID=443156 RepID=A0A1H0UN04_9MICO|nr:Fic family protein [Pedococcus dokdonensis]SDP67637.1 Fic/DOC family protein [Pedococcus dokdonensis]
MVDVIASLSALAELPGVPERIAAARDACEQLRWHEALRRRIPEASAESRVRGAQASAALEGATVPLDLVRDVMRGAAQWPLTPDPVELVARGAVTATAESEHVRSLVTRAPLQALARLHVAAAADLLPAEQVGRPRLEGETSAEFRDLGPAPAAGELRERLDLLVAAMTAGAAVPALVVAAVAHAEIATARPFVRANGVVARAVERALLQATGLDPTGVVVSEAGHATQGGPAYLGALAAYGLGTPEGLGLWIGHCADAVVAGAAQGAQICDAVRAGRLT